MVEQPALPAFLDVNVPMYAAGADHPYRNACGWIMAEVAAERLNVAIDVEIIQEILHRYGALGRHADAVVMARDVLEIIPTVYALTPGDIHRTIELFQQYAPQGLRSRDVLHVAVMQNHGLTEIISADGHFEIIPGLRRIDPVVLYHQTRHP